MPLEDLRWMRLLCIFLLCSSALMAQVDLLSVRFAQPRLTGQAYPWWSAELSLRPRGSTAPEDVVVRFYVRFKEPQTSYVYKGTVRLYALDRPAKVRFYLPPDAVRARRLNQSPEAYYVELSSSEGNEPFAITHAGPVGLSVADRNSLKAAASGELLAHYQTPFYSMPDSWRDLPSYVIP
jgi:hypothetical protein